MVQMQSLPCADCSHTGKVSDGGRLDPKSPRFSFGREQPTDTERRGELEHFQSVRQFSNSATIDSTGLLKALSRPSVRVVASVPYNQVVPGL